MAAAHHGGKLRGLNYRELIQLSKDLFPAIENILQAADHPDVCEALHSP
jgi:hypothetical protein